VGSENLLQRIAEDDESRRGSSQAIAKLLVKAYFPLDDGSRQVALAAALYNKKPLAARAFYGRLAELAPAEDVARFVVRARRPFHAVFMHRFQGRFRLCRLAVAAAARRCHVAAMACW